MTVDGRARGWLTEVHHLKLREAMLHTLLRYQLACPAYCLMPDHGHFLWIGYSTIQSHQLRASAFFRQEWNRLLDADGARLQKQAYDHVLTQEERNRDAFPEVTSYIFGNPVRAGFVESYEDWPFLGAMVPGYPRMEVRFEDYWERFWKAYYGLCDADESEGEDDKKEVPKDFSTGGSTIERRS